MMSGRQRVDGVRPVKEFKTPVCNVCSRAVGQGICTAASILLIVHDSEKSQSET